MINTIITYRPARLVAQMILISLMIMAVPVGFAGIARASTGTEFIGTAHWAIPDAFWQWATGAAIPMIIAVVRKRYGTMQFGVLLLIGLEGVLAVALELGNGFDLQEFGSMWVTLFVTGQASHNWLLGLLKITGDDGVIAKATEKSKIPILNLGPVDPKKVALAKVLPEAA